MSSTNATVYVVDDDASVRKSLARLLNSAGYLTETFASAREFLEHRAHASVGCVILDVQMPGMDGLRLQDVLVERGHGLPVIFVTGYGDVASSVRAIKAGADDFLLKPYDKTSLLKVVERVMGRSKRESRKRAELKATRERLARLTPREREVLGHLLTGALNKEIAERFGTVEKTIKVHRARVMKKMEAKSIAELVRMALAAGVPLK